MLTAQFQILRRLRPKTHRSAHALAPGLESKSGLACYFSNSLCFQSYPRFAFPCARAFQPQHILAFHRGFSIAERAAPRETDETFETLFPTSAPVARAIGFALRIF
jgi:hypothetical protein